MEIIQQPKKNHSGFNNIIFKVSDPSLEFYTIYVNVGYLNKSVAVKAEFFNGIATFDIKEVISKLFTVSNWNLSHNPEIWNRYFYSFPYTVTFPANNSFPLTTLEFNAYRGINQIGKKFIDFTNTFFATKSEYLKKYEGFPLEIACVHGLIDTTIIVGDKEYYSSGSHVFAEIPDNVSEVKMRSIIYGGNITTDELIAITTDGGQLIQAGIGYDVYENSILVNSNCVPENPFYVKWDNKKCGVDYWMFDGMKYITRSKSNDVIFKNYFENSETARKDKQLISTEIKEVIKVGAVNITQNEYDVLSEIIDSTNIQYYDVEINDWITILISDSKIENEIGNPTKSIELTFEFPTPQIIM